MGKETIQIGTPYERDIFLANEKNSNVNVDPFSSIHNYPKKKKKKKKKPKKKKEQS